MAINPIFYWMLPLGLMAEGATLHAALTVDSRRTELEALTQLGYLGGLTTTAPKRVITSLVDDLQSQLSQSDSGSGALGDTSWVASYEFSLEQSVELHSGTGFSASGSTTIFAFAGDQGVVSVDALTGNRLELGFSVTATANYSFKGVATDLATVTLERAAGVGLWTAVAEQGAGTFDLLLDLSPGQYRFTSVSGGYHDASQGAGSAWSAELAVIPEPAVSATTVGLLLGGVAWVRRGMRQDLPRR